MVMTPPAIDVHAHIFPVGLPDLFSETGDPRWPKLVTDSTLGQIMCGQTDRKSVV